MKKKIHRIWRLREMGLNVPNYTPITIDSELICFFNRFKERVSVRSQPARNYSDSIELHAASRKVLDSCNRAGIKTEDSFPPHAPNLDRSDAILFCNILLRNGFHALVCPMVDWTDSVWAGAAIRQDNKITLEIAKGPCLVRKVTSDGIIDYRYEWIHGSNVVLSNDLPGVDIAMQSLIKFMPDGMTVELSYYKSPVGINRENLLFWDGYFSNEGAEGWT